MTPERIKQLRELLAASTPSPWAPKALGALLKYADWNKGPWLDKGTDIDYLFLPREKDAQLIVEMRAAIEELLAIAEKPGRDGW